MSTKGTTLPPSLSNTPDIAMVEQPVEQDVPLEPPTARERSNMNLVHIKKGSKALNPKGRPPGKTLRQLIRQTNTEEKQAVVDKMYALAKGGDVKAAEWLAKHGETSALIEVSTRDFTIALLNPGAAEEDEDEDEYDGA